MPPLFGKKKAPATQKTVAVIDIGSSGVGSALAGLNSKGAPSIVFSQNRTQTPLSGARSGEKLADKIVKALREGAEQLVAQTAHRSEISRVEHIAVFLPAPWSQLYLNNVRLQRKEPLRVSSKLIQRMVADYVKRERPDREVEEVIERSAVGVRLNGYAMADIPEGGSATSIELTIISATASVQFAESVREILKNAFGQHIPISFHSTSVAATYALSSILPDTSDYLLCNSEGEVTELVVVFEHIPSGSATSPTACSSILRTVSVHADMARAEARSAAALARNPRSPMAGKLKTTLIAAQEECSEGFRKAATDLIAKTGAPRTVYVLGDGAEAAWYADAIAGASFLKNLFPGGAAVETIRPDMLAKFFAMPGAAAKTGKPEDIFLLLETLYLDARFDEGRSFNFRLK